VVALGVITVGVLAAGARPSAGGDDALVAVAGEPVAARSDLRPRETTSAPVTVEVSSTTTATTAPPATVPPVTAPPTTAAAPPTTAAPLPPPPTTTTAPPPPPTTAAPAPPPPGVDTACERELIDRTNAARAQSGLPTLVWDSRVHPITRNWSERMASAGAISHNPWFGAEMTAAGIDWRTAGENVGRGSTAVVFQMWMDSPAHRANILSGSYSAFAVGCIVGGGQVWVTQNFWG
jgi:uncharacterized protein YkwD